MKAKQTYYDRVSQVRILRGIIASLLMCIAVLLFAVFSDGEPAGSAAVRHGRCSGRGAPAV